MAGGNGIKQKVCGGRAIAYGQVSRLNFGDIAYTSWQWLDCMWVFHFQRRPLLSLEDARVPIPCQEVLWEAQTALDWQQLYSCADRKRFHF